MTDIYTHAPITWSADTILNAACFAQELKEKFDDIQEALDNMKEKRIAQFTASGNWTVPTGVTYAIANMLGGGGGSAGNNAIGVTGGDSSVAFTAGTVTAKGALGGQNVDAYGDPVINAPNNSGKGGIHKTYTSGSAATSLNGNGSQWNVAGAVVTPAQVIAVVVGAGGAGGSGANGIGGSGYVWIEYWEPVA